MVLPAVLKGYLPSLEEVDEPAWGCNEQVAAAVQIPHLVRYLGPTVHYTRPNLNRRYCYYCCRLSIVK